MIGQTISHYKIFAKLGEGGMGVVYKAEDTKLKRLVALKFLPSSIMASEAEKTRFMHEAQAAAALNHPNICTIYEIDEADGQQFIAMEFVEGQSLKEKIAAGPLKIDEALNLATQVAEGLQAAHEKGITHRDIKPANVMITNKGQAKIMDFGLAKLAEQKTRLTKTGMTVGTVAYMSPEQAQGIDADYRSDIWSFGVMLYEMITGQLPFKGVYEQAVVYSILNENPEPITALRVGVPTEVDRIVGKAMAKSPKERYQHLDDMLVDLRALRENLAAARATGSLAQARSSLWRRLAWTALVPALLVAGFFVWRAWRAPDSGEPLRAVPLTTLPGVERYPSFSPDGNLVAFASTGPKQDNPDIYVQQIGSGSPLRLTTDPSEDYSPVWSPDGRWIAFLRRRWEADKSELLLIPPLGGPERKVIEIRVRNNSVWPPYLAWCPDSDCFVVTDSPGESKPDALFVVSLETGEKRQLTNPRPPSSGDTNPAVSPDGKWLVFRRNASGPFNGELHRLPLGRGLTAAGEPWQLTLAALDAGYPSWMPDSREILFSPIFTGGLWRLAVASAGAPARLPFVGEDGLMPAVSRPQTGRPSRLIYVRSLRDWNFWCVETAAPGATASSPPVVSSISSTKEDYHPQFSPDGRRVAFGSSRSGLSEIWLADPNGSNAVQLTSGASEAGFPRWSPDGERILYLAKPEGQWEVYVIPAAGGKPQNITAHPAVDAWSTFSVDGKWIYFASDRTGEFQIWKIPATGGDAIQLTDNGGILPRESPDGAYLYYNQSWDKPSPLWRLPLSGGVPVKVLEGVVLGNFEVLEGGIYYIDRPAGPGGAFFMDPTSGETQLQYFDIATRRSTIVARNLGNVFIGLTASPDGRSILYTRLDFTVYDLMLVENFR